MLDAIATGNEKWTDEDVGAHIRSIHQDEALMGLLVKADLASYSPGSVRNFVWEEVIVHGRAHAARAAMEKKPEEPEETGQGHTTPEQRPSPTVTPATCESQSQSKPAEPASGKQ